MLEFAFALLAAARVFFRSRHDTAIDSSEYRSVRRGTGPEDPRSAEAPQRLPAEVDRLGSRWARCSPSRRGGEWLLGSPAVIRRASSGFDYRQAQPSRAAVHGPLRKMVWQRSAGSSSYAALRWTLRLAMSTNISSSGPYEIRRRGPETDSLPSRSVWQSRRRRLPTRMDRPEASRAAASPWYRDSNCP